MIGVTFGVFDCFHYGHLCLLKKAHKYCDFLIVAVQSDKYAHMNKPGVKFLYNEEERREIVSSIRYSDNVIFYNQIDEIIMNITFDILFVGPDQNNVHFKQAIEWCNHNNKKVILLERTPGISSTMIRNNQ